MTKKLFGLVVALASVSVVACGGGAKSPTSPSVAAAEPFNQTITGNVGVFGTAQHALTTPRAGTMTLRLAWVSTVDLDLYLSNGTCTDAFLNGCVLLGAANGFTNPESLTRTVISGESLKMWVDNLSESQSVGYTLTISIN